MAKKVYFKEKAQKGIRYGVNLIADAVKVTLGPRGRYVGLQKKYGTQHMTKDGVTVAKEIESADPLVDFAVKTVREASSKTADICGDGTTTATLLTQALYNHGLKYVTSGANAVSIQRGLQKVARRVIEHIRSNARQITADDIQQLEYVATISANNDTEMGKKIAEVVAKVGKEGVVTVEEYQGTGLLIDYVEGMQIDRGYVSPYMVTDSSRMEAVVEDAYVLVTDQKISSIKTILPIIEKMMEAGCKNLVIVAEDLEGDALTTLVVNKLRGVLNVVAVKAPGFGDRKKELLQDIAVLTGATVISEELGRKLDETVDLSDLGRVRRFVADKDNSIFVEGKGDPSKIKERIAQIRSVLENTTSEYDREKLQERLAKLSGGVAVVRVGAPTEVEMKEIKDRIDDAIHATKAALDGGIVSGGGVAYLNAIRILDDVENELNGDEKFAVDIMRKALREPMLQILVNAGHDSPESVVTSSFEAGDGIGYNALTNEGNINMFDAGIIDPTKVVISVIENATSVAGQLLATQVVVIDLPENNSKSSSGAGSDDEDEDMMM
ncbi:MAG: chaperonin GroEL [Candidatus Dojkabacteria bacterium]|nr:chaperonin GroEL [Candidatus Dojkabacteria bacterium]